MTEGFQLAFLVGAGFAIVGLLVTIFLVKVPKDAVGDGEAVPAVI
jgi:hypothetical protein